MIKKITAIASTGFLGLAVYVNQAHAALTAWSTTDTESIAEPLITSFKEQIVYYATNLGPWIIGLGFAYLIYRYFIRKSSGRM